MKKYQVFKNPYILIEDIKGIYKPYFKEYFSHDTPKLNLDSKPLHCPYTSKKFVSTKKRKAFKQGYCETCYVKYDDYDMHVAEAEHREYARDESNYELVDSIINEIESDIRPSSPLGKENSFNNTIFYDDILNESTNTIVLEKDNIASGEFEGMVYGIDKLMDFLSEDN